MNATWKKTSNAFPEPALCIHSNGKKETGELYCIEKTVRLGMLRATYEYNVCHWLEFDEWEADVVSPHGWHDLNDDELRRVLREFRIAEL